MLLQLRDSLKKRKMLWVVGTSLVSKTSALVKALSLKDHDSFRFYHRVNQEHVTELLSLVEPRIRKQDTKIRMAVTAHDHLSVTLRYLATGESKQSLGYAYRISLNLLSKIIPQVCDALYEFLHNNYMNIQHESACPVAIIIVEELIDSSVLGEMMRLELLPMILKIQVTDNYNLQHTGPS
ncbi:hypothetical protein Pcinc_001458 [Petrolisthes cinctipes]|uniref:Uncharacterized protein n=1 Tax=Petrolisthes cinctipes TaxID=88211 RepID=A0AAE1L394_PETCI|nr:hypothetical protein Pcinc_001458 [Petrolisthes cinctipes]